MEGTHLRLVGTNVPRCFVESDKGASLARRAIAEFLGTALLMLAVVGSTLHESSSALSSGMAVSASLIGLILAFGTVSGGHFNPTITIMQWSQGIRGTDCTVWYVIAQVGGALTGAILTDLIFEIPIDWPRFDAPTLPYLASEAVASFALMTIVFCCTRSASKLIGPFAVGLWLLAAIVSTPTGSIANPAVAIALLASPAEQSVFAVITFVVVQLAAGRLAIQAVSFIYPDEGARQCRCMQAPRIVGLILRNHPTPIALTNAGV
ncbi:aquaporin [Agrobacterium sp. lyk4-40-TYG-31]|uniref:aquaporin n=1 Tax=Agrobacterium sp. lyk4-40-TYG-31 TaxID=3040276 RepID=UPI00254D8435|nr:aquaporin [Agrobacterium sp. lyk4-40-TYG-31]